MSEKATADWRKIREIFENATRYSPDRRRSYVREVCGADDLLRVEVESLLDSYEETNDFLETPAVVQIVDDPPDGENLLSRGEVMGHYEIGELIGTGGMGEVYVARDLLLHRKVAIKLLRESFLPDKQAKQRLLREARTAASLEHPNICQIYEIAETVEHCFIVMQYLAGLTLADHLAKNPSTVGRVLDLATQILDGLAEAHARGIIHRDIKPANIIVNEKGQVKILDFGLAKFLGPEVSAEASSRLSTSGAVMGTVPFMSPEQLRGETSDERTDIFSFGVLLYEMLGGKPAFTRNSNAETVSAILNDEPNWSLIPGSLQPVLARCLAKNKAERYNSIRAVEADLMAASKGISDEEQRPEPTKPGRERTDTSPNTTKRRQFFFWQSGDDHSPSQLDEIQSDHAPPTPTGWLGSLGMAGVVMALLLLGSTATVLFLKRYKADDAPYLNALSSGTLTSWKAGINGNSTDFRVSHNGKMVAYSASRQGGNDAIYIKQTSEGDAFPVTKNNWENISPLWEPDDQHVAFISVRQGRMGIYMSPFLGGTDTLIRLIETKETSLRHWALDGSAIFYEQMGNLYRLDLATKEVAKITQLTDRYQSRDFSFSQDEKQIVFCDTRDGQTDIWIMPAGGGEPTQITNNKEEESRPIWHPDGRRIVYNVDRDDLYQINLITVGGTPIQLTRANSDSMLIDISPDGHRLYYASSEQKSDIERVDLDNLREAEVAADPAGELWAEPSPDGKSIVYQSNSWAHPDRRIEESGLVIKSSDGQTKQLASRGHDPRWLPDSRHICVFRLMDEIKGEYAAWLIDTVTEDEKPLTTEAVITPSSSLMPITRGDVSVLDFSPDGTQMVYLGLERPRNVKMLSLDGGDLTSLTKNENSNLQYFSPLFSRDGSSIAVVSVEQFPDQERDPIRRVQIAGLGSMKDIFTTTDSLRLVGWYSNDEVILATAAQPIASMSLDVDIMATTLKGTSRKLFTLKDVYPRTLTISPDGRTIAYTAHRDGHDDIWTLELSSTAEPRKVTSNANSAQFLSNLAFSANGRTIYFDTQEETISISMIDNFE